MGTTIEYLGLYWANGKENGNYYSMGVISEQGSLEGFKFCLPLLTIALGRWLCVGD